MRSPARCIRVLSFLVVLHIQLGTVVAQGDGRLLSNERSSLGEPRPERFPEAITQCEQDQCTRGGGGAIWIFNDGVHGQAFWHFGAVADLTVQSFDGRNVVIYRSDPVGTYSSRFGPNGHFTAVYHGTVQGDRMEGTVVWNGTGHGTWYATIPQSLCNPFAQCPLDANQVLALGQNAAKAKEYSAALHCFLIAGWQGNSGAQALAGLMLRDGVGAPRNYPAAFHLLQQSAERDDYNGELGLSQMYEAGLGLPQKDPERAAFWKNRAQKRAQELKAQQAQQQAQAALAALVFLGVAALILSDGDAVGNSGGYREDPANDVANRTAVQQQRRNFDYWSNGGTNLDAPPGYQCHFGSGC